MLRWMDCCEDFESAFVWLKEAGFGQGKGRSSAETYQAMQVVVRVQQIDLELWIPGEILSAREANRFGVLGREIDHAGIEIQAIPCVLGTGYIDYIRVLGPVYEWAWGVVFQPS